MNTRKKTTALTHDENDCFDTLLKRPKFASKQTENAVSGLLVGELTESDSDELEVTFNLNGSIYYQRAIVLNQIELSIGQKVVLSFLDNDLTKPIILGVLNIAQLKENLFIDRKRVEICAEEEILLKCGGASLRIDASGQISIRGKKVLSRSDGVNRIKGGAVQIN